MTDINKNINSFYLEEDRRREPKEYFKLIYEIMQNKQVWSSVCDVGCATGEFLEYIRECLDEKEVKLVGIDNFDDLLDEAKRRLPDCEFIKGDIYTNSGINEKMKYDVVTMSGVLSLFDDFERPFQNLIDITRKGGMVLVFSTYNANGCRVDVKYSMRGTEGRCVTFSKEEIGEWLENKGYNFEFIPFKLGVSIPKNEEDPHRSYTIPLADGTNGVINGLDIWHDFYLLKIDV